MGKIKANGQAGLDFFLSIAIWIIMNVQNAITDIARMAAIVRIFGTKMTNANKPKMMASGANKNSIKLNQGLYAGDMRDIKNATKKNNMKVIIPATIDQNIHYSREAVNG